MEVEGRLVRHSAPYRYVWPSELDLMAELTGFRVRDGVTVGEDQLEDGVTQQPPGGGDGDGPEASTEPTGLSGRLRP